MKSIGDELVDCILLDGKRDLMQAWKWDDIALNFLDVAAKKGWFEIDQNHPSTYPIFVCHKKHGPQAGWVARCENDLIGATHWMQLPKGPE